MLDTLKTRRKAGGLQILGGSAAAASIPDFSWHRNPNDEKFNHIHQYIDIRPQCPLSLNLG
jgi:hypothetical protein